jgi:hypothetical protein
MGSRAAPSSENRFHSIPILLPSFARACPPDPSSFSVYPTGGFEAGGAPNIGDMIAGPIQVTLPQTGKIALQLP